MPTVAELLAQTNKQLDALLVDKPADSKEEPEQKLAAADVMAAVAEELKAGSVSKERGEYLRTVLESLAKSSWEGTGNTWKPVIRILNDPMQIKPVTVKGPTIQSMTTGTPDSHWATNQNRVLSLKQKAEIIAKMILAPEVIQKGAYSDKLDDLKSFFGISDDDLKEEYDLRWKVGDLVSALQQAVKLEQFVSKAAPAEKTETEKAAAEKISTEKAAAEPFIWPRDMAGAKFDQEKKRFLKDESPFEPPSAGRS